MSDLPEQQTADFAALKARAPAGWTLFTAPESFTAASGPYFFREGDEPGTAFFAEKRHQNLAGIVHGGALATLADMALWNICRRSIGPFRGVTVTLNTEFLAPGQIGDFIIATGETTKVGGGLVFARGLITAEDRTLMSFSGALKRLRD